ncbi:MAG TPA: hypothetical protein VLZ76_05810 [Lysobacter sp.]|jgi:hypothetical protein|nr:hypothetical protein [Lysobacter sp.]
MPAVSGTTVRCDWSLNEIGAGVRVASAAAYGGDHADAVRAA